MCRDYGRRIRVRENHVDNNPGGMKNSRDRRKQSGRKNTGEQGGIDVFHERQA